MVLERIDKRSAAELRNVSITSGVSPYAEGSAEVCFGETKVLVTASVEQETPRWMQEGSGGWITAEYGMLPRATHTRSRREASAGKQGGRTLEIQRLIGRALRAALDLSLLEGSTIKLDCDVIVADGGTRTAAISGGWVALHQALSWMKSEKLVPADLVVSHIAAVSVGVVDGTSVVDLCYEEDSSADFDLNLVFNGSTELIEIQGTAEKGAISRAALDELLDLGVAASKQIIDEQQRAIK